MGKAKQVVAGVLSVVLPCAAVWLFLALAPRAAADDTCGIAGCWDPQGEGCVPPGANIIYVINGIPYTFVCCGDTDPQWFLNVCP